MLGAPEKILAFRPLVCYAVDMMVMNKVEQRSLLLTTLLLPRSYWRVGA